MQDRYTGDIGDFAKYGLLRALCRPDADNPTELKLGVVWYLVPDEGNGDGRFIHYLEPSRSNDERFKACDPSLYHELGSIVRGRRSVQSIRNSGILTPCCSFYEARIDWHGTRCTDDRISFRSEWQKRALESTRGCDLVFLDPDNGLECRTPKHDRLKGGKFAFLDEMKAYIDRGQSVIVYQSFNRTRNAEAQIHGRFTQMHKAFRCSLKPFALRWHRVNGRAFIVIPSESHRSLLLSRAQRLLTKWPPDCAENHFSMIPDPQMY